MKKDSSIYMSRKRFSAKKLSGKHKDPSKLQKSGGSGGSDNSDNSSKKENPVINFLESSSNSFENKMEESKSTQSSLFETKKKNKSSNPDFKGIGMFLNVYGEASISMEKQLAKYKKDLRELQEEFHNENDKRNRELIKLEINKIMQNIKEVKLQMKKLFNGANTITSKAVDILNNDDSERKGEKKKDPKKEKHFKDTEIYKKLFKNNLK